MTMKPDQLLSLFTEHYNMDELKGLCFDLGVKHEEVPGHNQTISEFACNIILYFARNERLPALIERCRELRPEASWPDDDSFPDFSAWGEVAIDDKELENYLAWVQTQYNTMRVLSMMQPLSLQTVYTDVFLLDKSKYLQKQEIEDMEQAFAGRKGLGREEKRIQGGELLAQASRFFIVGQPGAGKTTFSKWLALQAAQNYVAGRRIPVYLVLRRFNTWDDDLLALLAHELELGGVVAPQEKIKGLLRRGKLLILLDGLDEVLAEQRDTLNHQINDLSKWGDKNQIVITCRPHAETRRFEHFDYFQMADFTEDQVEHFVRHWFDDRKLADELLNDLRKSEHESIRELTRTPLLLALLCIGYRTEPTFPKRKDQLYERALQVVLQQWDEERGVRRESIYSQLSLKKKQALLAHVAYATFSQGQFFITEADLEQQIADFWQNWRRKEIERQKAEYGQVYPQGLPEKEIVPQKIIRELVTQHGLLVEQLTGVYSFSHLTLQEYFAALYVVENGNQGSLERLMPFVDDDHWQELFLLTAGMLADGTEFFDLFLQAVNQMVVADDQILACLKWVEEKGLQTQLLYKPAATRAFLFYYAYDLAYDLAQDIDFAYDEIIVDGRVSYFDLNRALARDHARGFDDSRAARDRADTFAFVRDRARDLARDHALDYNLARDIDFDLVLNLLLRTDFSRLGGIGPIHLDRILTLASALEVAERLELEVMRADLLILAVPDGTATLEEWLAFTKKIAKILDEHRHDWAPQYRVWLDEGEIETFMALSGEQSDKMARYFNANLLLVRCLEVAYVPNRSAIEDRILLPPS